LARLEQAAQQLLAAELLARAVVLDDHVGDVLDLLVGGEAPAAAQALAPAADGGTVAALPGVHHPVVVLGAEGTLHGGLGRCGLGGRHYSLACSAMLRRKR